MENFILPQASLFIGIIPALILLFIGLKGYEGHYKDKTIFLTFIIGIILGFIAALVLFIMFSGYEGIILLIILLAFFDQLLKTMILNLRRLQEKKETPIYGLSLGLGFGSAFTPMLIIAVSSLITNDIYVLSAITIGSFGIILFHGSTGAYIGYGIYRGGLTKYLLTAVIIQLPLNFILAITILYSQPTSLNVILILVSGLILYGGIIFWYVTQRIMPQILVQSKKRRRTNMQKKP
jgi:hypothetical protein